MNSRKSDNKSPLHLRGSIDIVVEFFNYAINSILYQRGIYPPESFTRREKYGLPLILTTNADVKRYLEIVLNQMRRFLETKNVHKIVVAILKAGTQEPVERWQFDVELDNEKKLDDTRSKNHTRDPEDERRALREIQEGLRAVMRNLSARVTFLPELKGVHSFEILLFTDSNDELANLEWLDMIARLIANGLHVRGIHEVRPIVSHRKPIAISPLQLIGSVNAVVELLDCAINTILYKRRIYPTIKFLERNDYGMPLPTIIDDAIVRYLETVLSQVRRFLETKKIQQIVVVIFEMERHQPVERWQFVLKADIARDLDRTDQENVARDLDRERSALREAREGIRGVIRQISASVAFLPKLEGAHLFDILLFTDEDIRLPSGWSDTNANFITNGEHIRISGLKTDVYDVRTTVSVRRHRTH